MKRGLWWQPPTSARSPKIPTCFKIGCERRPWAGPVTSTATPLGPLSGSRSRGLAPPQPQSQPQPQPWWRPLAGGEGPLCHHRGCSFPHGHTPRDFISFPVVFQALTQETQTRANGQLKPQQNRRCSELTQSSNYLSLNKNHHKADRPQTSPAYSLFLTLPCNFTSQKQNWRPECFVY